MKLELKYLAPYLPYGLKFGSHSENKLSPNLILQHGEIRLNDGFLSINHVLTSIKFKPILHQLSDLTKEIEVNGERFVPIDELVDCRRLTVGGLSKYGILKRIQSEPLNIDYWAVEKLFEWHFDVFNLIPENLAIDINKL